MLSTLNRFDGNAQETAGDDSLARLALLSPTKGPFLADVDFVRQASFAACMRYAVQRSGRDDFEIAEQIAVSQGYMSKVLKGTGGLYGQRLVAFMRATGSVAPLQQMAEQLGCEVVQRDSRAAEVAALRQRLQDLERAA